MGNFSIQFGSPAVANQFGKEAGAVVTGHTEARSSVRPRDPAPRTDINRIESEITQQSAQNFLSGLSSGHVRS